MRTGPDGISFFGTIKIQAEDNLKKAQDILKLYEEMKNRVPQLTHSQFAIRALDWLFSQPIFNRSAFIDSSEIPKPTAHRILSILEENNILKVLVPGSGRRSAVLVFPKLLNIAEGKEIVWCSYSTDKDFCVSKNRLCETQGLLLWIYETQARRKCTIDLIEERRTFRA